MQSEVATLAEASKEQAAIFTPYLLPDAHTLCSALHLVKKLMKTEKFVFIISKSGIYIDPTASGVQLQCNNAIQ